MFWLLLLLLVAVAVVVADHYALKKLTSLKVKIVIKSCFDSRNTFFSSQLSVRKRKENNLNSLLSDSVVVSCLFFTALCKRLKRRRGEKLKHSFAHTSPKMVTIILCFKSKSRRKIIGTVSKVNQNQITSKFHWFNSFTSTSSPRTFFVT